MKVSDLPSTDRFRASSDFELKLVTISLLGTEECRAGGRPESGHRGEWARRRRNCRRVAALFQTLCESFRLGASPLSLA